MVMEISAYEIVLGFALIIASYMTEYGTDKIERGHMGHQEIRYLEEHHPEILKEARTAVFGSEEAAAEFVSCGTDAESFDVLADGVGAAVSKARKQGRPLVCLGSLYMYADVKQAVRGILSDYNA